jgi:CRISPR-associated endoribonuclease Cas6
MPVIVELRLYPTAAARPARGRAAEPTTRQLHGLACALFEGARSSDEAHAAHDKPFTIWPLRPAAPAGWLLRGAWLPPGFPQNVLAATGEARLGSVAYSVTDLALRAATHEELAGTEHADGARVTLLAPAYFSQNGAYVTEPDPRLIVGSWRRRWNASLPADNDGLHIDDDLWRDIHLALHVTGAGLRLEPRDTGYRQQGGMTGTLTLRLEAEAPPAVRQAFAALARFAEYCGTGAQVTHGFGATKTTLLRSSWSTAPTTPPVVENLPE